MAHAKTRRHKGSWNLFEFVRGPVGFAVGVLEVADEKMCNWVITVVQEFNGRPLHHTLRGLAILQST
jgi:hypothetical protein